MRTDVNQTEDSSAAQASNRGRSASADVASLTAKTSGGRAAVPGLLRKGARSEADTRMERARAHFNEAMASIPPNDRASYTKAMERAPRLVEIESNPDHYLDHAGLDPWKAAARVAAYWETRVEFFGDRAFLPLTISGDGAMSHDDVELLRSGFFMVLPKDRQGRPVLFHDRSRIPNVGVLDDSRRHRCLFYILYTLSSTQTNRKTGFRAMTSLVKTTRKSTLEKGHSARALKLAQDEVFPIHCLEIHVMILSTRSVFMTFTTFCSQLALRFGVSQSGITIHNHAQSPSAADDALRDLQNHGFTVEGIPAVPFGGMYTIGCFREWLEDRRRLERRLHDPNATADGAASSTASDTAELHDTKTRKRRADASYCRKKRYLKRIEVGVLHEEVERLRHQNGRLKEEEARLEQRLVRAQSEVEAQRQRQSRITTSLPSLEDHERAAAVHGSILRALSAPCAVSSGQVALNQSFPFPDPRLLGRSIPSLGWSDPHGSLGPATQSNTPLGAPVQARPNLCVQRGHYTDPLLRLQWGPPPTAATYPLLSRAEALHAQYPLQTMHLDRNRLQLSNERTDPHDLQQLLVERFLREAFPSLRRSQDA